jgi:hypothetical protein
MLSWYQNSTLHCMPPMQPSQLFLFLNAQILDLSPHNPPIANSFFQIANFFKPLITLIIFCTIRRTSGLCLGTFRSVIVISYPTHLMVVTHAAPPNFLSLSLSLSISQLTVSGLSRQCGILNISQPYRPSRPVTGIALLYGEGVCFL